MASIVFVRHAQPDWPFADARGLKGSARDLIGLTALGVAQAEATAGDDRLEGAALILSSPYTRALHTAAVISRVRHALVQVEYDLREWVADTSEACDTFEGFRALAADFRLHAGVHPQDDPRLWEPLSSLKTRVLGVLDRYADYGKLIVVSHEMAINSVTGVPETEFGGIVEWKL